jgi:glycerol-3-phosphate acyltransferase PlsX
LHIGIDLMGGDSPPESLFPAVLEAVKAFDSSYSFLVIATKIVVDQLLPQVEHADLSKYSHAIQFHIVPEAIAMDDDPLDAVRKKKESSLMVGIRLLKKGAISAFVSCGNTGALVAATALLLPKLPGMERPGLLALLPTLQQDIAVLDVGGNVRCKARHLVQFARFGASYQHLIAGIELPKVGLLNIGAESKKGTQETRQAYEILKNETSNSAHFVGNVEARDIFTGNVHVLITDGFTGNVLLKAAEGVASFVFTALGNAAQKESTEIQTLLDNVQKQFNYTEYPGAIVCGIDGVVLKSHGNSSSKALFYSIQQAAKLVEQKIIPRLKQQLSL